MEILKISSKSNPNSCLLYTSRHNKSEEYDIIKIKNIEINLTNSKVYKDDKEIELKALEYKICLLYTSNIYAKKRNNYKNF